MVESGHLNADGRWVRAMHRAGLAQETIDQVVVATVTKPEDLITLDQAVEDFGIPLGTLYRWMHVGHLREQGRERFPARGGGKVLVDRNDVAELAEHRPKPGRPPKNGRRE